MDRNSWWQHLPESAQAHLHAHWIPVGPPGFAGAAKRGWRKTLRARFGDDGWRIAHIVRGEIVSKITAVLEYEAAYRHHLLAHPELVAFLTTTCGNVYDYAVENVYDDSYAQPHTEMNHYQDISVRRVISELVDDPAWPEVVETAAETVELVDLDDGRPHQLPRARGFRGDFLLQIREPHTAGFMLNPAVVPMHDAALLTCLPSRQEWYHREGCAHLSVEAFWQMSKVIMVRYDRFLALGDGRAAPLAGL